MARQDDRQQLSDKEQFWRDMLLLWQTSGQTIRAFCHAQRVPPHQSSDRTQGDLVCPG